MTVSEYPFLIPKFFASTWHRPSGGVYSADLDWPRVGIYCPHDPQPWLLGSFVLSEEVLEQQGTPYWGWELKFLTGDGYLISLNAGRDERRSQYLVGNAVRDRAAEHEALRTAMGDGQSDLDAAQAASDQLQQNEATTRARVPLVCGVCQFRRVFRAERVQPILTTFWRIGMREVELQTLAARVDRSA